MCLEVAATAVEITTTTVVVAAATAIIIIIVIFKGIGKQHSTH